jgi:thioesterase domain-containing protein
MHDGWTSLIRRKLEIRAIPAEHLEVFSEPYVQVLAAELTDCIQQRCAAPFHAAPSAPIVSALNLRT